MKWEDVGGLHDIKRAILDTGGWRVPGTLGCKQGDPLA